MANTKQITVFGGTGFIGRYLVDRLCDMGYTVRVATRRPSSAYFLRTSGVVGQVVPVPCGIFNEEQISHAIAGSEHVINLIGILTQKGRQNFDNVHHLFPARLAKISAALGVRRFIQVSALGASKTGGSEYARSKASGEEAILAAFPKAIILRPSIIFGPEDGFFNKFAEMGQIMPFLPLIGGGKTKFQPVYVEDVVNAIVKSLTLENVEGRTFELAGDDQFTFKELLQKIMALTYKKTPLLPIPFALARFQGWIFQHLPGQILTADQVRSLQSDNVATGAFPGLRDLGIDPTPLDAILPTYLDRYRKGGRFARARTA